MGSCFSFDGRTPKDPRNPFSIDTDLLQNINDCRDIGELLNIAKVTHQGREYIYSEKYTGHPGVHTLAYKAFKIGKYATDQERDAYAIPLMKELERIYREGRSQEIDSEWSSMPSVYDPISYRVRVEKSIFQGKTMNEFLKSRSGNERPNA